MSTIDEKLKLANDNVPKVYEAGGAGIDLSEYVKKTDYASASMAGVVKVTATSGIMLENEEGSICIDAATLEEIDSRAGSYKPIVPETLEYAVQSVMANNNEVGVARFLSGFGLKILSEGTPGIAIASLEEISHRSGAYKPLAPVTLNAAVKAALTDSNRITNMTASEQSNARDVIGAEKMTKIAVATTSDIVLNDKVDTRVSSSVTTINLTIPTLVTPLYESAFSFQSGTNATTLAYPGDTIKFVGVDCDEIGDFIPTANKNYEVIIKNMSHEAPVLVARVGVY